MNGHGYGASMQQGVGIMFIMVGVVVLLCMWLSGNAAGDSWARGWRRDVMTVLVSFVIPLLVAILLLGAMDSIEQMLRDRRARRRSSPFADTPAVGPTDYLLNLLAERVPKRIANEEIGDALESLRKMQANGLPVWFIYMKVGRTFFWVGVHTLEHHAERLVGIVKIAAGRGNDQR